MRDQLTALEITDLVKRLAAAYGKPYGARTEALVAVWDDKLRYYPGSVVRSVLERWIETESRFPTIAAILARVRERMPSTDAERNPTDPGPYRCPTCGEEPTIRRWYIERRVRTDDRPIAVLVGDAPHAVPLAIAWRALCRCEWEATIARRSPIEREAMRIRPLDDQPAPAPAPRPPPALVASVADARALPPDEFEARKAKALAELRPATTGAV